MIPLLNKIYLGNTLDILKTWDNNIIDMCVTSPPYWKLRSYEDGSSLNVSDDELGHEGDYDSYIFNLCDIFDEVKRILTPMGTLWVNIGDSYFGQKSKTNKLSSQCLTAIPFRFTVEMINRGWILRNTLIWKKKNGKPESCTSRFTNDFEYMFLFSKQEKYYFKQQFEPLAKATKQRAKYRWSKPLTKASGHQELNGLNRDIPFSEALNPEGRNARSVWDYITTSKFKSKKHYATYPESLIRRPIDAGCPCEVCTQCGKPREWIIEREKVGGTLSGGKYVDQECQGNLQWKEKGKLKQSYWSKCECNVPFRKGIVFDPFMGTGTSAVVALEQHKDFLGTELNEEYFQEANERLKPFLQNSKIDEWI